ncbi:MAG TPA: hypothetical protein VNT79_16745, partial [Phycisphaerae bacterium]|nr:hypothetical protein [Phycisphaerae bacterium]
MSCNSKHLSYLVPIVALATSLLTGTSPGFAEVPPPSMHRAVREDDTTKIRGWLHKDMKLLNARDADGMTPLQVAVCKNRWRAFDLLIASGADVQPASRPAYMKIDREDGTVAFQARRAE